MYIFLIKRCCEIHDKCYREYDAKWASQCGWTWFDRSPYTEAYSYECDASTGYITSCSTENSPCEKFLCECDKLVLIKLKILKCKKSSF